MARTKAPVTAAVRALRQAGIAHSDHLYRYEERGGTAVAARELGLDEHDTVKTLVMEDQDGAPLIVLMHGDREVSTRALARQIGARSVQPCAPAVAQRHTGYQVGGTSPFGTRRPMPVFMEHSIATLPQVYINGGKRGYLMGVSPQAIQQVLQVELVDIAIRPEDRHGA